MNGQMERPTLFLLADRDVIEGKSLSVVLWLSRPADHDVTGILALNTLDGPEAQSRWLQPPSSFTIAAGQSYTALVLPTLNDALLNGHSVYTLSIADVHGADARGEPIAVTLWDDDEGVFMEWVGGTDVQTGFAGMVRVTRSADGRLTGPGTDFYGHPFSVTAVTDTATDNTRIEVFIEGIPSAYGHWTGTSDLPSGSGRYALLPESGVGMGSWNLLVAADVPHNGPCDPKAPLLWDGTATFTFGGMMYINTPIYLDFTATARSSCYRYVVTYHGYLEAPRGAMIQGAGYYSVGSPFRQVEAPAEWPLFMGDRAEFQYFGVGGSVYTDVSLSWTQFKVGSLIWRRWQAMGGFNIFTFAGGAFGTVGSLLVKEKAIVV